MTGTIWSEGIHQVYVDGKPAKVKVPQYTIPETFKVFQAEIEKNGGITLGIDHLSKEVLAENPILEKLNLLDVGKIKRIGTDGSRIYALETEHSNPLVDNLYSNNELPDYSVVGPILADVNEGDDADYVFNNFKTIKRADYVGEGGCSPCNVGNVPDNLVMTAKLSIKEEDNLTNKIEITQEELDTLKEKEQNFDELQKKYDDGLTLYNKGKKEFEDLQKEEQDLREQLLPIWNDKEINASKSEKTKEIEAKLAGLEKESKELKLEAKKAKIEPIIDKAIEQGKILPVDREMFLQAGLSAEDVDKWKKGLDKRETVVDLDEKSKHLKAGNSGEKLSMEDMRTARQAGKF
jgi:hypothetical protein